MTAPRDEGTVYARVMDRRDEERRRRTSPTLVIREEEALLEDNPQGRIRWYLHPELPEACFDTTVFYRYEIPPHSATGKQLVQGNLVSFVVSGHGYSVVNDVRLEWESGDVIGLPPLKEGVVFQHFNESDEVALLVTAEPNWRGVFDVDLGSGFEQLEPRPEEGY
jgi:hypothetical protein